MKNEPASVQYTAKNMPTETEREYEIAFQMESGEFDVVTTIVARNDAHANRLAEKLYPNQEWYVLLNGQNINA
jgi:hypothetical protein